MKHAANVAIGASPVVTFGALHMLGSSSTPQWAAIADDLSGPRFWLTMLVMLIGGAFGGITYELLLRGGVIELPHRVRADGPGRTYTHAPADTLIALGIVGRALVGSAAAICVLLVIEPGTAHAAVALSVTSGAAAPAVIRLLRKQLLVACEALSRVGGADTAASQPHPHRTRQLESAAHPA